MKSELFSKYFKGRTDVFAEQKADGTYKKVDRKFTLEDIENHLSGHHTFGIFPVEPVVNICWHTIIDIDEVDLKLVASAIDGAENLGIDQSKLLIEFSGSKGYHIWVRFKEAIPACLAKRLGEIILLESNLSAKIEVFPKQAHVAKDQYGNLIKLPFGIHRVSNKRSTILNETLDECDDWEPELSKWEATSLEEVKNIVNFFNQPSKSQPQVLRSEIKTDQFSDKFLKFFNKALEKVKETILPFDLQCI